MSKGDDEGFEASWKVLRPWLDLYAVVAPVSYIPDALEIWQCERAGDPSDKLMDQVVLVQVQFIRRLWAEAQAVDFSMQTGTSLNHFFPGLLVHFPLKHLFDDIEGALDYVNRERRGKAELLRKEMECRLRPVTQADFVPYPQLPVPTDLRVSVGVRVSIDPARIERDWTEEALRTRQDGVRGVIVGHHDSHGLCYDVRHEDDSIGCYSPWELVAT